MDDKPPMTDNLDNQQILEKAIQKAIDGGWKPMGGNKPFPIKFLDVETVIKNDPRLYVFSHDFAKALWGEGKVSTDYSSFNAPPGMFENSPIGDWKSHLKEMVIAENPLEYLGDNLPE